jgi:CHAD domain-containing protein
VAVRRIVVTLSALPEVALLPVTTGELALRVLGDNAAAFLEHAPGAQDSRQPEHVHQMRVATRRLRAALRLFSDVLPSHAGSLSAELKWIAGQLGTVRDLDVQIQRLRENAVELSLTDALIPYAAWLEDQRGRAQAELVEALTSQRYIDLTDRLAGTSAWVCDPSTDQPLVEDAPRRIKQAMRRVRKRADAIDKRSSTADLHAVRIRGKRLRYTVEFYVAVYGKPAERFVESVVAVQDVLGNLQDGVVSGQHIHAAIQTAAGAWPADTSLALGQTLQFEAQHASRLRRAFQDAYRAMRGKRWRRLRREM